jgi:integron integrase
MKDYEEILKEPFSKLSLLNQVRYVIRKQEKSLTTERAYCKWIKEYIFFHNKRHPRVLKTNDLKEFISYLVSKKKVSGSTQNNALTAIKFMYKHVLRIKLEGLENIQCCKVNENLPNLLSESEVHKILIQLDGTPRLILEIMYGSGLTMVECIRLRIQDIQFQKSQIFIRKKGCKGRWSMLSKMIHDDLKKHITEVKKIHQSDCEKGYGFARAVEQNKRGDEPSLVKTWGQQWLFPSNKISKDPRSKHYLRHHLYKDYLRREISKALPKSGIIKKATVSSFRSSFAMHLIHHGYDIRSVQKLIGHQQVDLTMKYDPIVLRHTVNKLQSPLETLFSH